MRLVIIAELDEDTTDAGIKESVAEAREAMKDVSDVIDISIRVEASDDDESIEEDSE